MTGQLQRSFAAIRAGAEAGLTAPDIAGQLHLKVTTVRVYASRIGVKLAMAAQTTADLPSLPIGDSRRGKRFAELLSLAEAGRTRAEAAKALGMSYVAVSDWARRYDIKFRRAGTAEPDARSETMSVLFRNGYTLQQIGDQYGISRERVRQIITKRHGLTAMSGGDHIRAERAKAKRRAIKDAKSIAKYGFAYADYLKLRDLGKQMRAEGKGYYRSPLGAFKNQRRNARVRGIGWELTLAQWWAIWHASGKWGQRGRGAGYVMCRNGDIGPYSVGNVYIATGAQNICDSSKVKKSGLPLGVRKVKKTGSFEAHRQVAGVKHRLGTFKSPELAHAAYLACGEQYGIAA